MCMKVRTYGLSCHGRFYASFYGLFASWLFSSACWLRCILILHAAGGLVPHDAARLSSTPLKMDEGLQTVMLRHSPSHLQNAGRYLESLLAALFPPLQANDCFC
jgi:hypothetical protein